MIVPWYSIGWQRLESSATGNPTAAVHFHTRLPGSIFGAESFQHSTTLNYKGKRSSQNDSNNFWSCSICSAPEIKKSTSGPPVTSASNLQSFCNLQVLKMQATRRLLSPCAAAANLLQPRLIFPRAQTLGPLGSHKHHEYDKD